MDRGSAIDVRSRRVGKMKSLHSDIEHRSLSPLRGSRVFFVSNTVGSRPRLSADAAFAAEIWSFVVPLTLLSAYLLLSRPRSDQDQRKTSAVEAHRISDG